MRSQCPHRGGDTPKRIHAQAEGRTLKLAVYRCALHGECTIAHVAAEGVRSCEECPDHPALPARAAMSLSEPAPELASSALASRRPDPARLAPCSTCGPGNQLLYGPDMPAANALRFLDGPVQPWMRDWAGWPGVIEAHQIAIGKKLEQFRKEEYPAAKFYGRGVVIAAGGAKYFACAWIGASLLRWLGCRLPVQFWHLGPGEMDPQMKIVAEDAGIEVIDARAVAASLPVPPRILNGWELKPFAVMHSRFREVLFLDADSMPVKDPTYLFDAAEYLKTGSIFWPDIPPNNTHAGRIYAREWLPPVCWTNCGLEYRQEVDFESGQFLVDKSKCWPALRLAAWMNEHSDFYYKFLFGDKSTYHLAWRRAGIDYAMPSRMPGCVGPSLRQHDFAGDVVFEHATTGKEWLAEGRQHPQFLHGSQRVDAWRVLRDKWNGQVWGWAGLTTDELQLAQAIPGLYDYARVGLGSRRIQLLPDGQIGEGRAACEKRWTLRLLDGRPTLVFIGEAHKGSEVGMMLLTQGPDGWTGKWEYHEQSPVTLTPVVSAEPPDWFTFRPGSWDRAIFDCVVRENEYKLPDRFAPGDVVVDLGAHVGAFSWAALARGAGLVMAVEAHPDNYARLAAHLSRFGSRVRLLHAAAVAASVNLWELTVSIGEPPWPNTGGAGLVDEGGRPACALNLDTILTLACPDRQRRIRFLKLDIEGAEVALLAESAELGRVDEIALELHATPEAWMGAAAVVRNSLLAAGFGGIDMVANSPSLGLVRARR